MTRDGPVRIALAQIDCVLGDLAGNAALIEQAARRALAEGAGVLLTPELSLCGYPPEDLVLRTDFVAACERALQDLCARLAALGDLHVVVGHPRACAGGVHNAASVLHAGRVLGTYAKRELPNYGVFDERRVFVPGGDALVFERDGTRFGVNICEDAWFGVAPQAARDAGAQVLLVANGSPWHAGKPGERLDAVRRNACAAGLSVAYCNLAGAQDELVFDGASFVLDAGGVLRARAAAFSPDLLCCDLVDAQPCAGPMAPEPDEHEALWRALREGLRAYVGKNGFGGAIVGLSGGIDSALVLAIAADALGPDRVRAVLMPSRFTAAMSLEDARQLASRLGVRADEIGIEPAFGALLASLQPALGDGAWDATQENLQARVRGTLLMALSNRTGAIVLTTGNKSEMAVGYCTLYGDMAGAFALIKDLTKRQVYALARHCNRVAAGGADGDPVIPARILERPPSAELRPDQTDQDTLPPYDLLDDIVERFVERGQDAGEIIAAGLDATWVRKVVSWIRANEYKRRQAPVGVRVTPRAFGRDWRFPITNRFRQ